MPDETTTTTTTTEATTTAAAPAATDTTADAATTTADTVATTSTTDTAATTAAVPETYTLALPEGSTLDAGVLERTAAIARTLGLSNDAAQKLVETTNAEVQQFLTAEHAQFEAKAEEWKQQVLADPKYGKTAEERAASIDLGRQVIDVHFAKVDPEGAVALKSFLDDSTYGNHPAVVSLLHYLGMQGKEGPLVLPTPGEGGPVKSAAELFYGPNGGKKE